MPYKHYTSLMRDQLQLLLGQGMNIKEISQELAVHQSSVYREIKRNSVGNQYISGRAQSSAVELRYQSKTCPKQSNPILRDYIQKSLEAYHSPEQISGRIALDFPTDLKMKVSTETVYTIVYGMISMDINLKPFLRQAHKKRRKRLSGRDLRGCIPDRVMIDTRPQIVENKSRCGDWEGDTIEGAMKEGYIATFVDRMTKLLIASKMENKKSATMVTTAIKTFKEIPAEFRETLTLDNGKEFAGHLEMAKKLDMNIFFARPYHSWERGLNEHTNGLLRQFFPKGMSYYNLTHQALAKAVKAINNRPRKILGYRTPQEVWDLQKFALQI